MKPEINAICTMVIALIAVVIVIASLASKLSSSQGQERGAAVVAPSLRAKRSNPCRSEWRNPDCFVATLLAMTLKDNVHDFTAPAVSPPTM